MAVRPVFIPSVFCPYYETVETDFTFFPGFAPSQKKRSVESLHDSFLRMRPNERILEISSKSDVLAGKRLSAFYLPITLPSGKTTTVECAFQSSKVFENGGPYRDLLNVPSYVAKKDERIRHSGELIGFDLEDIHFPLIPKTFFYDWLYVTALSQNPELVDAVGHYTAFSDIEFNPKRSINCQARSAAIFVSLCHRGLITQALQDKYSFLTTVYGDDPLRWK